MPVIVASSSALALVLLVLIALKWRVSVTVAAVSGIIIGILTGLIVSGINSLSGGLNAALLVIIELALIFIIAFIAVMARFYRDPQRHPEETGNVIISPADGKIVYVNYVEKGSALVSTKGKRKFKLDEIAASDLLTDTACLVGIDMNILNVHVNRSPIPGKIVFQRRTAGKFISLRKQESESVNERVTTIVSTGTFKVGVIQIASRLVRKIVSYHKEGESLEAGQRIGAIVFGSQVDIAVPALENLKMEVKPGDEVKAGVTVIARYGRE